MDTAPPIACRLAPEGRHVYRTPNNPKPPEGRHLNREAWNPKAPEGRHRYAFSPRGAHVYRYTNEPNEPKAPEGRHITFVQITDEADGFKPLPRLGHSTEVGRFARDMFVAERMAIPLRSAMAMEKPLDPFDVPYNPKYVFDADDGSEA